MKYNVIDYLRICFALTKNIGYQSCKVVSRNDATFFIAKNIYLLKEVDEVEANQDRDKYEKISNEIDLNNPEYKRLALDSIDWLRHKFDGNNSYFKSIQILVWNDEVEESTLPILASFPKSFLKYVEITDNTSDYVGAIGENLSIKVNNFREIANYETMYGRLWVYQFSDKDGNIFVWKTSKIIDDAPFIIKGKVKDHIVFNGIKETVLTRCQTA